MPIVASYQKLVAVAENRRQSIEIFHYRLLECCFRQRNASQRINLGDPISDENTACFLHIGYRSPKINLPKTIGRTSKNKNGFLAKDATIVLTVWRDFPPRVAVNMLAKIYKNYPNVPRCNKMERNESHLLI